MALLPPTEQTTADKPEKPAIALAIRGFPFVNVHKGKK
jgi:hypothetical protein